MQERYFAVLDERKNHYLLHTREKYDLLHLRNERIQELLWYDNDHRMMMRQPCIVADAYAFHAESANNARDLIGRRIITRLDNSKIMKASAPIADAQDTAWSAPIIKSFLYPLADMESTADFSQQNHLFEALLSLNKETFNALLEFDGERWFMVFNTGHRVLRIIITDFDGRKAKEVKAEELVHWTPDWVHATVLQEKSTYRIIKLKALGVFSGKGVEDKARTYPLPHIENAERIENAA